MKTSSVKNSHQSGSTLIESSIAMGVLALAVPLVFGSMAEAGKSGRCAEAESSSTWIIPACIQEIEDTRAGRPQYFATTETGQNFPPEKEIWALAFSNEGSPVGRITVAQYDCGIKKLDGKEISHLAKISTSKTEEDGDMLKLRITLEHPAAAPAGKRKTLDFHSRIP